MDVLEKKSPANYKDEVKKIIKMLTYKKCKVELKGSASLSSQKYPADYDLYTEVRPSKKSFLSFLKGLLKKIDDSPDYWFIELKFQTKADKKIRIIPNQPINEVDIGRNWKQLDFVKLDMIARIENRFTEVSIIYSLNPVLPTPEEYKKSVENDINELKKEGNYYKILKRQFSIYKTKDDKKNLLRLTKIFNSDMGKEYQLISNLETIQILLDNYQDKETVDKVRLNLRDLRLPDNVDDIEKWAKERKKLLNDRAKEIYEAELKN